MKGYEFDAETEAILAALCVSDRKFYASVGHAVDTSLLTGEQAKRVIDAVRLHTADAGDARCSAKIVAQKLKTLRVQGKITFEDAADTVEWLTDAIDSLDPRDTPGLQAEIVKTIRHSMRGDAIRMMMALHGKRSDDFSRPRKLLDQAEQLGVAERPDELNSDDADLLDQIIAGTEERLPTGIPELDDALEGGPARGELSFALGASGDGKSMWLSQVAASSTIHQKWPYIATLELSKPRWTARLLAALTCIPINTLRTGAFTEEQRIRLENIKHLRYTVGRFTAGVTTMSQIWDAFDEANERLYARCGERYESLIIDYADKLGYSKQGSYEGQGDSYEELRTGGESRGIWTFTASQSKRNKEKSKDYILTKDDAADSQNKIRVTDIAVTLNASADRKHTRVSLVKNRNGECNLAVSSLMETDFAFGRLTVPGWLDHISVPGASQKDFAGLTGEW